MKFVLAVATVASTVSAACDFDMANPFKAGDCPMEGVNNTEVDGVRTLNNNTEGGCKLYFQMKDTMHIDGRCDFSKVSMKTNYGFINIGSYTELTNSGAWSNEVCLYPSSSSTPIYIYDPSVGVTKPGYKNQITASSTSNTWDDITAAHEDGVTYFSQNGKRLTKAYKYNIWENHPNVNTVIEIALGSGDSVKIIEDEGKLIKYLKN